MHLLIFYWSKLRTFAPNIIKSKKKNKFFYYLFKNKCSKYCTSKTGSMAKEIRNREDNYSEWYNNLVIKADLAENSAVRGCMVIKPYGYAIWEKMQADLDRRFKETGHVNAYFPLFIPKSFLSREAEHVEGFAKECAVVTHHRLMAAPGGKGLVVDPSARLEEELIVRPTSETIIWNTYRNWIKSYRDLPILCNQWANVVRWEMRTRLFLRTAEFLWQEGHTAHATAQEAMAETRKMVEVYASFAKEVMALPVWIGPKTATERFAGAVETLCIEALMQDGKALQAGTSHFLGQNFARAFDVQFANSEGKLEYVWATSWGVSTRLMGALVMAHSDNNGLVLPPKLAPVQVVLVPIYKGEEERSSICAHLANIGTRLQALGITVKLDDRDNVRSGFKFSEWELKGVPVRIAVGPRDLANGTIEVARRDTLEKQIVPLGGLEDLVQKLMHDIQNNIYDKALDFRNKNTFEINSYDEFRERIEEGGFFLCHWDGTPETEARIKEETKATIRLIPEREDPRPGNCMYTGKPSAQRVVFARAY
jgi:prolyl-tRNA synthetase